MKNTRQIKLQSKLFIAYLSLTVVILLFCSVFFYNYVSQRLLRQEQNALTETLNLIRNSSETVVQGMDTVSINMNYSSLVQDTLDQSLNLNLSEDTFKSLAQLFVSINGTDTRVDYIYLYDFNGNMLQVDTVTNISKIDRADLPWMNTVDTIGGGKLISPPYYKKSTGYSDWSISLYRSFVNQYGTKIGYIETTKRCKNIFSSIRTYQNKTTDAASVYVYDKEGALIYPYNASDEELAAIPNYYDALSEDESPTSYVNELDGTRELFVHTTSAYTGWNYVVVQKQAIIVRPVQDMLKLLLLFTIIMLVVSALVSYRLSRSLVRPIKHLKHVIQRMQLDTLGKEKTKNYPTSVNELSELYNAFENMSENLKDSMNEVIETRQQEMKSRSLALQSQINPHFYYNSLSNVIVLAENGMTDEIIQMCRNLTSIMRYITDNSSVPVSLREEIDYVKRYLYCMKVRYQSSLDYTIDVPDSLMDYAVPRLLLQPIVENALKYGTNCNPPWWIKVQGVDTEDHWQIDVIDSGSGFSPEAKEKVRLRLEDAVRNSGLPEMHIDGMGLVNVYLRWRLFSENPIIFTYGTTEDGHGIVSIGCKKRVSTSMGENSEQPNNKEEL